MASNLERVGVILVAEGIGEFLGLMADAGKAVVGFLGDSINLAGDFEKTMNVLQETSGATADQMALIGDKAKALGSDLTLPATSAVDAGQAMLELSKGGLEVEDAMDAAKGTLQLAAAAETDVATAANITTGALSAFGLEGKQAGYIADVLANSANLSRASITDMSQGFQQAAFRFHSAGQGADDLATSLVILTKNGLTGSDAGTALQNMLARLQGPTDKAAKLMAQLGINVYDAHGNMKPMPDIIGIFQEKLGGMTQQERNAALSTILLGDGMKAMIPLLGAGADGFLKTKDAVNQQGAAADLAAAQTKGFKGSLEGAKSQLETLQLTIGEKFLPILADLLSNYISPGIAQLNTFTEALFGSDLAFEQLNPTLQRVLGWLDSARSAWSLWEKGVISTRTALDTLIPGLGDRLGPVVDRAIQLIGFLSNNFQTIFSLISGGQPTVNSLIGFMTSLANVFGLTTGQAAGVVRVLGQIGDVVQTVIASFQSGGVASQLLGTYVDTLRERWNVLLPAITMVAEGVWGVVSGVFGAVQTFLERHGDEVLGFITTTWTAINSIINDVMQIVALVVGDKLQTVANYFDTYGAEIQTIMTVAWNIVSGVITTALSLIQGIVRATLQAVQGDWSGAWTTIQNMSARFVATINNAIQSFLDKIAGAFGTSLAEIRATWSNNWDMLVQIATKVVDRVKDVGSKIVNAIKSGFENAWSGFIASAQGKLQEFRDMLPFSEPKDPSSPLANLAKSGESIIGNLTNGVVTGSGGLEKVMGDTGKRAVKKFSEGAVSAVRETLADVTKSGEAIVTSLAKGIFDNAALVVTAARTLGAKMIAQFGDDGKKAADALTSSMRDALDFRASIPRAMDSIDDFLKGVGERLRQTGMYSNVTEDVQRQVQQALLEAQKLSPKDAAQFFKLRTDQIKEMTALQEQLFTATDAERGGLATRIARIFEAQKLELQSFLSQIEGGGGIVSPPATLAQLLTGSNTVTNYGPQINYSPSYASGPSSPNYDYAVLQALTP